MPFQLSELAQMEINAANHLQIANRLSGQYGPAQAHALLETALLRKRAVGKFSRAGEMYFTREALQQATAEDVVQTVWMSLLRSAESVRDPRTEVKWLLTARRSSCRATSRLRTRSRSPRSTWTALMRIRRLPDTPC